MMRRMKLAAHITGQSAVIGLALGTVMCALSSLGFGGGTTIVGGVVLGAPLAVLSDRSGLDRRFTGLFRFSGRLFAFTVAGSIRQER